VDVRGLIHHTGELVCQTFCISFCCWYSFKHW